MLGVQSKSMLLELRLEILTSAAVFAIHRRFHNHARSTLVCSLRYLHGYVAICCVHRGILKEGSSNVKNLKLAPGSRRVGRNEDILRPGKNRLDGYLLRGLIGDWDVLGKMPVIGDVRLNGQALAEIFRFGLQETKVLPATTHQS